MSIRRTVCLLICVTIAVVVLLALASEARGAEPGVEAPKTFFEYFLAGGKLMWAILACSVVAVAFAIERTMGLRRQKVIDDGAFSETIRLLEAEGPESARSYVAENKTPMARVLWGVLSCADSPRAEMETVVEDAGARELWGLQRNAKPLGITSNVAPLLGLLGTVIGIIRAFSDVASETGAIGNPKMLATGIYEALITTAAGLSVAIPAYLLYHYFRDKADVLIRDIEEKALQLIAVMFEHRGRGNDA